MNPDWITAIAALAGAIVGPFAGTWFGVKMGLNGLRERSKDMQATLHEVRDYTRDTKNLLGEYTHEGRLAMSKIDRIAERLS